MTNNLKAERTLTADRLEDIKNQLGDDTFAGITRTAELKVPELRSIIEELQSLRSQSLSTQQPMGEVRTPHIWHMSLADHEERLAAECFKSGFAIEAEEHGLKARFHRNSAEFFVALHPNQESGE